jgi:hypothetical protein
LITISHAQQKQQQHQANEQQSTAVSVEHIFFNFSSLLPCKLLFYIDRRRRPNAKSEKRRQRNEAKNANCAVNSFMFISSFRPALTHVASMHWLTWMWCWFWLIYLLFAFCEEVVVRLHFIFSFLIRNTFATRTSH